MKIFVILLLATGLIAGFLAGLLGIGGGIIIIPLLFFILNHYPIEHSQYLSHIIFGSSNGIIFITSLRNFYNYYKNDLISISNTLKIAIFCLIGGFFGGKIANYFSSSQLKLIFGIFLLIISIRMFFSKEPDVLKKFTSKSINLSTIQIGSIGLLVGIVAGFFGIGGGVMVVPLLNIFFKVPILFAQGFSVSLVPFNSIGGVAGYVSSGINKIGINFPYIGFVNILIVGICSIVSIISTKIGLTFAKKMNKNLLKKIFAIVLLLTSIKFIFT